jgi:hypothetical protein
MRIVVGALLILHGLITVAQSGGSFNPTGGLPNPKWLSWWPIPMGQSWLLARLGLESSFLGTLAGLLWLVSGAALIAAALGLFGFIIPTPWWRALAGVGAVISLLLFIIYAHPLYTIGIGANIAILLVLLWAKWPSPEILGS